jgi:hypothetical protein
MCANLTNLNKAIMKILSKHDKFTSDKNFKLVFATMRPVNQCLLRICFTYSVSNHINPGIAVEALLVSVAFMCTTDLFFICWKSQVTVNFPTVATK